MTRVVNNGGNWLALVKATVHGFSFKNTQIYNGNFGQTKLLTLRPEFFIS